MSWHNVKLIFQREVRDQARDRRTLFMIGVLPLLLYPLLGMSVLQLSQFLHKSASRILVLTEGELPTSPPLIEGKQFSATLFEKDDQPALLEVQVQKYDAERAKLEKQSAADFAQTVLRQKEFDAVVLFPPDFVENLEKHRAALSALREKKDSSNAVEPAVPKPEILHNSALEKSQAAFVRVYEVMHRWQDAIGKDNLEKQNVSPESIRPFELHATDVAEEGHKDAAIWSKILPFVVMIWALTGAFYPAVDLCAGEKERGTLETLLSSPAQRSEIVCGKLLTIMAFSMATSLLNLLFMGLTGVFIIQQIGSAGAHGVMNLGPPPVWAAAWLVLALVPISAFFSALCLAIAAFARSTKEGQYYLMPLILIILPLMVLPMTPGTELDLGKSLIPVTGLVLLLRALLEGNYQQAAPFILPVIGVTLIGCWLAIRWAVEQFNKESVLFREGERLDVGMWLRHLVRDREDTPSPAEAVFCGVIILAIVFVLNMAFAGAQRAPLTFRDVAVSTLVLQLTAILTPALLMAIMLTGRPDKTLLLGKPQWLTLPAAALLAIALHPFIQLLRMVVMALYPLHTAPELESLEKALFAAPSIWQLLLIVAVTPAICEELAFRGFILSGLRKTGGKWRAIILTSLFFGITHSVIQQSLTAFVMGCVIGYIAVQTNNILPGMLFHVTNNVLGVILPTQAADLHWDWLLQFDPKTGYEFTLVAQVTAGAIAAALLYWFSRLPNGTTQHDPGLETAEQPAGGEMANTP